MAWIYLLVAACFEVVWAVSMKSTEGLTKFWPSLWTLATSLVSFILLAQAMRTLPTGTSYAVWTGLGAAGTAICGILLLHESPQPTRILCIALIVAGIVGLKLTSDDGAIDATRDAAAAAEPSEPGA